MCLTCLYIIEITTVWGDLCDAPAKFYSLAVQSYGGKFVPSISHFILQASDQDDLRLGSELQHRREIPADTPKPNFKFAGMSIGNGLTEPVLQVHCH